MAQQTQATKKQDKKRSKAAKIVLWAIAGCAFAMLIVMLVTFIIAATGGTGTSNGSILGMEFGTYSGLFFAFLALLVFVYLITEPSFKKEEEVYVEVKPQYVKKAVNPRSFTKNEEKKPAEEEKPAEEAAPAVEEEKPAEEEKPVDEADDESDDDDDDADDDNDAEDDDDTDNDTQQPEANEVTVTGEDGVETVLYRYRRSFMSKIVQSADSTKSYYAEIKNKLLSYKNVKSRTSWSFESFNFGRKKMAKLNVKGKTLVLHLALDPAEYVDTKYHIRDMSDKAKYAAVPATVRVKSPRACKFAIELIEQLMEKNEVQLNAKYVEQDFHLEYRDSETLVQEGLIKVVYNKALDPNVEYKHEQANIADIINK